MADEKNLRIWNEGFRDGKESAVSLILTILSMKIKECEVQIENASKEFPEAIVTLVALKVSYEELKKYLRIKFLV